MADFASNGAGRVAVLPDREMVKGIDSLKDLERGIGTPIQTHPLSEAFTKQWSTDAHFVCYIVEPFDPTDPVFRLNKRGPLLGELIQTNPPTIVTVYLIAVDLDTEGHEPWTVDSWNSFLSLLKSLEGTAVGRRLAQAFVSYPTRRGWRWVFRVRRGIPAMQAEPYIRGLIQELYAGGLPVDRKEVLATWNCDFRLPCVVRDGKPSTEDPFFIPPEIHAERFIERDSIVTQGQEDPLFAGVVEAGDMPDEEECKALMSHRNARNVEVDSSFARAMRRDTEGKDFWPYVFGAKAFQEPEGTRHDKVRALIMSASGYAFRYEASTAKHLYAMFRLVANELHDQDPQGNRKREVWRLCQGAWNKLLAEKVEIERIKLEEQREASEKQVVVKEGITQAVRRWFPGLPGTPGSPEEWKWISDRLILRTKGNKYHVMKPVGFYSAIPTEPEGLLSRIKQLGMDKESGGHIATWVEGKQGPRPIKRDELSLLHVRNVDRVEIRPEIEGAYLLNPHKDEGLVLVRPSFRRRRDLVPHYSPDVDLLIQAYARFDPRIHEALNRHIASFLAFERGGTAAMSFNLMPGSGKKLVTHGFLECMEEPDHATGEDLVQKFNTRLSYVPFMLVNEGLPEARYAHYHPSDTFRKIITGDYFQSESKGVDADTNKAAIRVIMTANHWRLIDALGEGRDLSSHEREALGVRLVHYNSGDAPGKLLRSKGGFTWTKGWIEGDGGETSDFVVARHFLWLYEKYGKDMPLRGRLLVEGDPNQPAIRRLRARGGSTPIVMEALVRLLGQSGMGAVVAKQGIRTTTDGRLYTTGSAILDYWRNNLTRGSGDRLTLHRVTLSLKGLVVGEMETGGQSSAEKARFHEIDVLFLAEEAHEAGWLCPELDRLVEQRRAAILAHNNGNGHASSSGRLPAAQGA